MKQALGLGLSIVATWFESFLIHPCRTFWRQTAKLEERIQRRNQNLRHARSIFYNKIQGNIPNNQTQTHHRRESKHWLGGSDMKYWPQQLNFAVFCMTQGCGISCDIFDNRINLPPQIRAFYIFHVYFTVRRILYQLGGI